MNPKIDLPDPLVASIRNGNCVAFVGAGFSAAAQLPTWSNLLITLAASAEPDVRERVEELVRQGSGHSLDQAAQTLEDHFGRSRFVKDVSGMMAAPLVGPVMARRLELLKGIPFRAVLTTNFDGVLDGDPAGPDQFAQVLRPHRHRWWEQVYWLSNLGGARIKLHGDATNPLVGNIVLTRLDYRRRLYGDAAYMTFLRSVFSTSTVLYLGCSFEDAYLNELRSEVLSLIGFRGDAEPIAYAIMNDVPVATCDYFRRHEGIEILSYDAGGNDWSGFDRYLEALFNASNPLPVFGRLLESRRILWIDPHPENNIPILDFFGRAAQAGGSNEPGVVIVENAEQGLARLALEPEKFQLVITHWGEPVSPDEDSTAVKLLRGMRERDLRAPVLVFSTESGVPARKPVVLSLGAQAYCHSWDGLLRRIAEIFDLGASD